MCVKNVLMIAKLFKNGPFPAVFQSFPNNTNNTKTKFKHSSTSLWCRDPTDALLDVNAYLHSSEAKLTKLDW